MANKLEEVKVSIAKYKEQLKSATAGEQSRRLRKRLKRAQRKHQALKPLSAQEHVQEVNKHLASVTARLSELQKQTKKPTGDPTIRSLRKKTKSLNKKLKRLNKLVEKQKPSEPAAAPAPQPAETKA